MLDAVAVNVSTGFKKICNEKILNLPVHPLVIKSLEYDQCLYDKVVKPFGFEPGNFQIRVKELEATGLSNLAAQQVADAEVESGEYSPEHARKVFEKMQLAQSKDYIKKLDRIDHVPITNSLVKPENEETIKEAVELTSNVQK